MLVGQISRIGSSRALCLAVCLGVNACRTVDGGAVELSWKLRPASGSRELFVDCDSRAPDTHPVTAVRLEWEVGEQTGFSVWNCTDYHGVTGFDLPPGTALLRVAPECATGPARTSTYISPAPLQREVSVGNTISLGAVEMIVQTSDCSEARPCICQ